MLFLFFVQVNHFQEVSFVHYFIKELEHELYILQEMVSKIEFLTIIDLSFTHTVFPHIVAAATILFLIHKSLKISYSFLIKFFLM